MAQRVRSACVRVGEEEVCRMEGGLLALVGVHRDDGPREAEELARRLVQLRVFEDTEGRMNRSLLEAAGTLGVVSQFTLYGDTRRGRRPGWSAAAPAEQAEPLLDALAAAARGHGVPVVTGRFRAEMAVELINAGPVTLLLDTEKQI